MRVSTPRRHWPLWQNTQLVDMIRADEIDVSRGTHGVAPLRPMDAASVITVHDLVHRFAPATRLMTRWKQRACQRLRALTADRPVAVSRATADDMRRSYWPVSPTIATCFCSSRRNERAESRVLEPDDVYGGARLNPRRTFLEHAQWRRPADGPAGSR